MIVDGFLFNDEFDILELRLMELDDLVDRFVLVESPYDFQQGAKPLHFAENSERFAKYLGKIRHIVAETPCAPHPVIEHESRRQIFRGFEDLDIDDVILLGDVDEIPSRKVLEELRRHPPSRPVVCMQHLYYYRATNHAGFWNGTICMARGLGKIDLQELRDQRSRLMHIPIEPSGWHFSWFGDAEDVKHKLRCIDVKRDDELYRSHLPSIPDPDSDSEFVDRAVAIGDDLFGRESTSSTMPIQPGVLQPECIKQWLVGREKYGVDIKTL